MTGSARAEVRKLARLLATTADELAPLLDLPPAEIERYREEVTALLGDADADRFERIAEASWLLPARIAATIAYRAFGPLLTARLTGSMDPARAIEIAAHLPEPFLAEVAAELDPRRALAIVRSLPVARIVASCREMAAMGEHVAMGRFVGHLDDATLRACIDALDDDDLAAVAIVLEGDAPVDRLVAGLSDARVVALVRAVAAVVDETEATLLVDALGDEQRARVVALLAAAEVS